MLSASVCGAEEPDRARRTAARCRARCGCRGRSGGSSPPWARRRARRRPRGRRSGGAARPGRRRARRWCWRRGRRGGCRGSGWRRGRRRFRRARPVPRRPAASPVARVAYSCIRSRRMNGRSEPSTRVVHSRIWSSVVSSSPMRSGRLAEVQAPVGGDGVDAVVARPDRQAAGGVEELDLAAGHGRGDVEDPVAAVLEQQRRRHQPHGRVVEDEERRDAHGGERGRGGGFFASRVPQVPDGARGARRCGQRQAAKGLG